MAAIFSGAPEGRGRPIVAGGYHTSPRPRRRPPRIAGRGALGIRQAGDWSTGLPVRFRLQPQPEGRPAALFMGSGCSTDRDSRLTPRVCPALILKVLPGVGPGHTERWSVALRSRVRPLDLGKC